MTGHTRWEDIKKLRPEPSAELRAQVAFDHALGLSEEVDFKHWKFQRRNFRPHPVVLLTEPIEQFH